MPRAARSGPSPTPGDRPTRDVGRWEYERGLRGAPLGLATRGVLAALVSRMDPDGTTRRKPQVGALAVLAADLGESQRVVKDHLRRARDAGYLRREGKSHTGRVAPWIACLPAEEGLSQTFPFPAREGTRHTTPAPAEGSSQTSERGRPARQRGVVPDVPLQTFQTNQTSSSPREEPAVYVESADRPDDETTTSSTEEQTIADELRSLVDATGKSSAGWTDRNVERVRDTVWDKLGTMAEDWRPAARFLARRGVESPLAYLSRMSPDDVRAAAVPPPPARTLPPRPRLPDKCDDPRCGPTRRLEDLDDGHDLGPCPSCHPTRTLTRAAS